MVRAEHVSVVMPAYNAERFIARALESVLGGSCVPAEVIVVDDGSVDATAAVAAQHAAGGVRVFSQPNAGEAAALNAGVARAHGSVLAFLDADDEWSPDKLERQLPLLDQGMFELVYGQTVNELDHHARPGFTPNMLGVPVLAPIRGAMIVRRSAWDKVGPLDESYRTSAIFEWWSRALDAGLRIGTHDEVVLHRRIHDANIGVTNVASHGDDLSRALRTHLLRKRQAGSL